jgi:hypothetical protein
MADIKIPVLSSRTDTRLRNLTAILAATGGSRDCELEIVDWVWASRARSQVKRGVIKPVLDSDGGLVCYRRVSAKPLPDKRHADPAQTWQKTPSGGVHVMQLKIGRRGRKIPANQTVAA